jgi:hypothetical protein
VRCRTFASSAIAPAWVGVEQHVLHAVVRVHDDEDASAAVRYRRENLVDENLVVRVER